jgi:hypothetical protein
VHPLLHLLKKRAAASLSVTSGLPFGSRIGSSNCRDHDILQQMPFEINNLAPIRADWRNRRTGFAVLGCRVTDQWLQNLSNPVSFFLLLVFLRTFERIA